MICLFQNQQKLNIFISVKSQSYSKKVVSRLAFQMTDPNFDFLISHFLPRLYLEISTLANP